MTFAEAVKAVYSNYAKFDGRARRSEYWYFTLFVVVVYAIGAVLQSILTDVSSSLGMLVGIVLAVFWVATIIPSVAVAVRRLHDTGKSGWFLLIGLIPLIGAILLIIAYVKDSEPGDNAYGPSPKGAVTPAPPPPAPPA